jgi:hypothetical protein
MGSCPKERNDSARRCSKWSEGYLVFDVAVSLVSHENDVVESSKG